MDREHRARIDWTDVLNARADAFDGAQVEFVGFPLQAGSGGSASHFLLLPEAMCCAGHGPRDPRAAVAVLANNPLPMRAGGLRLSGQWRVQTQDPADWRYQLHAARSVEPPGWRGVTRRGVLAGGPLMCLAASQGSASAADRALAARAVIEATISVDIHSHAGGIANSARIRSGVGFSAIQSPMQLGGMAAICLAVVSDAPTHHLVDGRIRPYRDPDRGELYTFGALAFERVRQLVQSQHLPIIATEADLRAARAGAPHVIISAEGADFLEGDIDRVDEAHQRWTLRHLQLTHYRVNELGDIQTEARVHGGLTDFGAAVIRRCNRLGIVVDVAHGTFELVQRAASVTSKPLVLSHTSLSASPGLYSRHIGAAHAKLIAGTGGVIGIWPPVSVYPTLTAMATGMARMADIVGVDHVGLGTDLRGLVGDTVFPDYYTLPALSEALLEVGFNQQEAGKILGGNYTRVFAASLAPA